MATTTLDIETRSRIEYLDFIIIRFARGFKMSIPKAYRYLKQYGGLDFINENWKYEQTLSEHETLEYLLDVCHKNGGGL